MDSQQFWHLFFVFPWMFVFCLPSVCSGMNAPKMRLENTVFVAFAGEDLRINCELEKPANQSKDILRCFSPHGEIYHCDVASTDGHPHTDKLQLELKKLTYSGEYNCQYKTAKVYFFLRVRAEGYKEPKMFNYTKLITVATITGVLLILSVIGSVYVFRGYWKEKMTESGDRQKTSRKPKDNREERKKEDMDETHADVMAAESTSFYASLETRPRSIYDVLDHSAASREPDRRKPKPKKKKPPKTVAQTTEQQDEGVFECVYENF
ncbi:uncharacterized protein si:ch211-243a20.4 [Amphiprion ocellaris]|uniref:uncharacterized protein si:ch211-243a20.4 n=1 Tax=Amphiprion ocellaris TaxID=80972 RepID=UPI0024111779|nr:uncharacterized protein si:ch211-243a20.4 [Amphiprion ocellaris]